MELGTIEEVELIVDQIASNKIPPPNKAQSLVIIRQMVRMAKRIEELKHETMTPEMVSLLKSTIRERNETVEAQAKEIAELREQVFWLKAARPNIAVVAENERLKALCDQMASVIEDPYRWCDSIVVIREIEKVLTAWRESK